MNGSVKNPLVAVACGGTGGHLFPGLAVAGVLQQRGCEIDLLISQKEVDQQAVEGVTGIRITALPAVGLTRGGFMGFARGFWRSFRHCNELFRSHRPDAVLAMGGFTSAPPVLAGRRLGAKTFFHESNAVPGRANRLLAHCVNEAFLGFPTAVNHLFIQRATTTGTPVRPQFRSRPAPECRAALGLDPNRPVLLTMGGSQGASAINKLVIATLTPLMQMQPAMQYIHLTGPTDFERVKGAHDALNLRAVVRPFMREMETAMGAATLAISRAGASSLAEIAALRLPSLLIPLPTAVDNHQFFNASYFSEHGAARVLRQNELTAAELSGLVSELVTDEACRARMSAALARWHAPDAAEKIADRIASAIGLAVDADATRRVILEASQPHGTAREAQDPDMRAPMISILS